MADFRIANAITVKNMKLAVMRIGIDLGVFDVLAERREADTQTIADIRGADPRLVCK